MMEAAPSARNERAAAQVDWTFWEEELRRFEDDWRRPEPPSLDAYLEPASTYPIRFLAELAQIDLEFRWRRGERPALDDYLRRFPELAEPEFLLDLIFSEMRLRRRHGQPAELREYQERFPQLAERLASACAEPLATRSVPAEWLRPGQPAAPPQIPGLEELREIGHGGMGIVYQARQPALNRTVAVKTLAALARPEAAARFRREAEAMARLDHPNIVPVHEVGEWRAEGLGRAIPYFIMKWLPGGSLAEAPAGFGSSPRRQARLVAAVARAVHHAHERGVLHRDLKPSNILLDEKGEPSVADFGLASQFDPNDPKSLSTEVVGTPAYMAPEQARAPSQVTTAADVYGLGALLYHQLAGQPPHAGETALATLEQAAQNDPPPPSRFNSETPRDLDLICLKCLRKDPGRRYATAAALADDLEAWLSGFPIAARPSTPWERAAAAARRRPAATSLALGLALAFLAAFAAFVFSYSRIREQQGETARALQREIQAQAALREALEAQERQLYIERIAGAGRLHEMNQLRRSSEMLDACPAALRGWEWRYLDKLRRKVPIELPGQDAWLSAVAFLPNGDVAGADAAGMIFLWRPSERKLLRSWQGADGPIVCLAASPDGRFLAASTATALAVWKVRDETKAAVLAASGWCSFAPDGDLLAAADQNEIFLYRTDDWSRAGKLDGHRAGPVRGVFAPDGALITAGGDLFLRRWDVRARKELGAARPAAGALRALALTADGSRLIEGIPGEAIISSPANGKFDGRVDLPLPERLALATAPKDSQLAIAGQAGEAYLWDLGEHCLSRTFRGHSRMVTAVAFSPDGRLLATAGGDALVRIWDLAADPEVTVLAQIPKEVAVIAVSADGAWIAAAPRALGRQDQNWVRILDAKTGAETQRLPGFGTPAFTPDGSQVAVGEKDGVALFDRATGKRLRGFPAPQARIIFVAVSSDGRHLAAGDMQGRLHWWALKDAGAAEGSLALSPRALFAAAFAPQGDDLFVVGTGTVARVNLRTQSVARFEDHGGAFAVAVSADGAYLATSDFDKIIRLRDGAAGRTLSAIDGHYQHVMGLAFSPDGSRLVSGGADRSLRLWDTATGKELLRLPGLAAPPVAVAWLPGRNAILAIDNALRMWQAAE